MEWLRREPPNDNDICHAIMQELGRPIHKQELIPVDKLSDDFFKNHGREKWDIAVYHGKNGWNISPISKIALPSDIIDQYSNQLKSILWKKDESNESICKRFTMILTGINNGLKNKTSYPIFIELEHYVKTQLVLSLKDMESIPESCYRDFYENRDNKTNIEYVMDTITNTIKCFKLLDDTDINTLKDYNKLVKEIGFIFYLGIHDNIPNEIYNLWFKNFWLCRPSYVSPSIAYCEDEDNRFTNTQYTYKLPKNSLNNYNLVYTKIVEWTLKFLPNQFLFSLSLDKEDAENGHKNFMRYSKYFNCTNIPSHYSGKIVGKGNQVVDLNKEYNSIYENESNPEYKKLIKEITDTYKFKVYTYTDILTYNILFNKDIRTYCNWFRKNNTYNMNKFSLFRLIFLYKLLDLELDNDAIQGWNQDDILGIKYIINTFFNNPVLQEYFNLINDFVKEIVRILETHRNQDNNVVWPSEVKNGEKINIHSQYSYYLD